jgi:hypothetical protein
LRITRIALRLNKLHDGEEVLPTLAFADRQVKTSDEHWFQVKPERGQFAQFPEQSLPVQ